MRILCILLFTSCCYGNLVTLASSFTDDSDQPLYCCGPCTRCRPGLYIGSQFGYAWIDTTTHPDCTYCCRGSFMWGAFGGYSMRTLQTIYIGFQAGFNDNGHSLLTCDGEGPYKVRSRDWELLGSFNYIMCKCLNVYFKGGVARVNETFRSSCVKEYHPTVTTGAGMCVCGLFNLFLQYRGIFAYNQPDLLKHISTVHSISSGFQLVF